VKDKGCRRGEEQAEEKVPVLHRVFGKKNKSPRLPPRAYLKQFPSGKEADRVGGGAGGRGRKGTWSSWGSRTKALQKAPMGKGPGGEVFPYTGPKIKGT